MKETYPELLRLYSGFWKENQPALQNIYKKNSCFS